MLETAFSGHVGCAFLFSSFPVAARVGSKERNKNEGRCRGLHFLGFLGRPPFPRAESFVGPARETKARQQERPSCKLVRNDKMRSARRQISLSPLPPQRTAALFGPGYSCTPKPEKERAQSEKMDRTDKKTEKKTARKRGGQRKSKDSANAIGLNRLRCQWLSRRSASARPSFRVL